MLSKLTTDVIKYSLSPFLSFKYLTKLKNTNTYFINFKFDISCYLKITSEYLLSRNGVFNTYGMVIESNIEPDMDLKNYYNILFFDLQNSTLILKEITRDVFSYNTTKHIITDIRKNIDLCFPIDSVYLDKSLIKELIYWDLEKTKIKTLNKYQNNKKINSISFFDSGESGKQGEVERELFTNGIYKRINFYLPNNVLFGYMNFKNDSLNGIIYSKNSGYQYYENGIKIDINT